MIEKEINALHSEYRALHLSNVTDYDKYKLYSIVTASTAIEGSTLTDMETQILLDENVTAKGKPLEHHLMVRDNYDSITFALQEARVKRPLSPGLLIEINCKNMQSTGAVVNSALGTVDGRLGEFRKVAAFSQALGYYLAPEKIPEAVETYCRVQNEEIKSALLGNTTEKLYCSFAAQARLIVIHPWQDGNKRTSRVMTNYIEHLSGLPLTKVHKEDIEQYLQTLKTFKDTGELKPFSEFMLDQHVKTLKNEINLFHQEHKKDYSQILNNTGSSYKR